MCQCCRTFSNVSAVCKKVSESNIFSSSTMIHELDYFYAIWKDCMHTFWKYWTVLIQWMDVIQLLGFNNGIIDVMCTYHDMDRAGYLFPTTKTSQDGGIKAMIDLVKSLSLTIRPEYHVLQCVEHVQEVSSARPKLPHHLAVKKEFLDTSKAKPSLGPLLDRKFTPLRGAYANCCGQSSRGYAKPTA
ncbi:hypothetical protein Tco_0940254 [Tanacetum coccineum]|uniref:Uncharacterized protein n=1 Tax=Tanacetum coccineum TaxID=301880 RepID=A0ABQ5DU81_9ASTR